MNVTKYLKKRMLFFVCSFVIIAILTTCATYAISNSSFTKSSYLTVQNNNLKVTYINNETTLNMLNYPLTKDAGYASSPSNVIKIENEAPYNLSYQVVLTENSGSNFDLSKLYYSINDTIEQVPSDGILYINNIDNNMEDMIDVKIWLGSDLLTNDDIGSKLNFNLNVLEYNN